MSRAIPIAVALAQVVLGVSLAAEWDPVSDHDWLHVTSDVGASDLHPADLEIDEESLARFREAEHPFVDLLERHSIRLAADGTVTTRTTVARRFLTADGVRNFGNMFLSVRAAMQEIHLEHGSLRMPDGATRAMDLRRAQVTASDTPDVFSDVYSVVVPFEGLVPGATAVLSSRTVHHSDRWPLPWSTVFTAQRLMPIRRLEVEVTWDDGVEAPTWATDADYIACESTGSGLRCGANDIAALVIDQESPNVYDDFPHLVLAEPYTWEQVALAEAALVERSTGDAGDLKPLLARLLEGADSEVERLHRIHRFVADDIRYVSLSHGAAAVAPAPVARTLDRRYGDCKDKVATFIALAREAGFHADPVLVATSHTSVEKLILPSMQYFDHMIACVNDPGVEPGTCVDLTAPSMRTGDLPPSLYRTVALDLVEGTAGPRRFTPPDYVWDIEIDATNRVACDGTLTEELRRSFHAAGGGQLRAALTGVSPEDRTRWIVEEYQGVMGDAIEPEASVAGLDSPSEALTFETTTEFQVGPADEMEEYVENDSWLLNYAQWFETLNETRAYRLPGARIRSRATFDVCKEKRVRFTGAALDLKGPYGALRRVYNVKDGNVEVVTELTLPEATIGAEELEGFRRFLTRATGQSQIWFNFEQRSGSFGASR